jgi:pyruvate ferredoxin oxidoreductase delta subunit
MKKNWMEIPKGGLIVDTNTSLGNKTGDWRSLKPEFIPEKCIHCMKCVFYCPEACIPVTSGEHPKRLETNFDYCKGCGICAKACPKNAIIMKEEEKD